MALATAAIAGFGCSRGDASPASRTMVRRPAPTQASGEVSVDSTVLPPVQWLTDANMLALLGTMNSQQIAAANIELQSWHSDTVRALAAQTARVHAELQHSTDSLATQLHVTPVSPALDTDLTTAMRAQVDSLKASPVRYMDRAFIAEQVNAAGLMMRYMNGMVGSAQRSEIQAFLSSAASAVDEELTRARGLQMIIARGDSTAAADSARVDSARIHGRRARP